MKKVTAIILAILILATISCSIAEDVGFSIRNNVQFGDTIETVKSKDSIFQNEKVSDVVNRMYSADKVTSQCMAISDLTLGDIDKFILLYYFVDSKLKEITYYANISPFVEYFPYTMDECISLYNDLESSLVNNLTAIASSLKNKNLSVPS